MMVLVLPEWVAPHPSTEPALKPEFDWVVVLVLPKWVAPKPITKWALKPKFDKVSKLAKAWAQQGKQAG
jgi:hypothetical protein